MCEYGRTVVSRSCLRLILVCVAAAVFAQQPKGGLRRREAYVRATALAELGRKMFFDTSLSASGTMSCASCHDPAFAYAPANALAFDRISACVSLGNAVAHELDAAGALAALPSEESVGLDLLQLSPERLQCYVDETRENFAFVQALCRSAA